jgi:hypothetical protein
MGNQCQDCGEKDPMVLCIDHIKPVGYGNVRKMTVSLYHEIVIQPEVARQKYQLLCRNCNWRKMILNNERAPEERQFALKQEHDVLKERVALLEHKIRIRQTKITEKIFIKRETKTCSEETLEKMVMPVIGELINRKTRKLDVNKIRLHLRKEGTIISHWKAYAIKGNIEAAHPEVFERGKTKHDPETGEEVSAHQWGSARGLPHQYAFRLSNADNQELLWLLQRFHLDHRSEKSATFRALIRMVCDDYQKKEVSALLEGNHKPVSN